MEMQAAGTNQAIFTKIADYVKRAEFQSAQHAFFEKHKGTFDEAEENKLEYTTIHEAYIYMLDTLIGVELKEEYSDQQIDAFYEDFKNNHQQYEGQNPDVVMTLLEFLDFQKFKAVILEFKRGVVDHNEQELEQEPELQTDTADSVQLFWELYEEDPDDPQQGWALKSQSKDESIDFKYWQRPMEGQPTPLARSECFYAGVQLATFDRFIADIEK